MTSPLTCVWFVLISVLPAVIHVLRARGASKRRGFDPIVEAGLDGELFGFAILDCEDERLGFLSDDRLGGHEQRRQAACSSSILVGQFASDSAARTGVRLR